MAVIDLCTRLWETGATRTGFGASRSLAEAGAAYERAMGCVDGSFVFGPVGGQAGREGGDAEHEALLNWAMGGARRGALVVAGVDLLDGSAAARVARWVERGAAGIAVCPAGQGVRPTDDRCWAVLERAASLDVPVFVLPWAARGGDGLGGDGGVVGGCDDGGRLAFGDPLLFDEAASSVRGLRLVLCELGRVWTDSALAMLERHAGVYAETSWLADRPMTAWQVLGLAHERGVLGKLLFGSGYPRSSPQRAIAGLYSMQSWASRVMDSSLPREGVRAMIERDALGALRVPAELLVRGGVSGAAGDVVVPRRARRALVMGPRGMGGEAGGSGVAGDVRGWS